MRVHTQDPPGGAEGGAAAYIERHPELSRARRLEVHYGSEAREAFRMVAERYALQFQLHPPGVGVSGLWYPGVTPNVLAARRPSLNIVLTTADGGIFETSRAATPARINIFRHGPHYQDVHVFDLVPTAAGGATLPVRGEVVFHAYPDRLFLEVRLHTTATWDAASAVVRWHLGPGGWDEAVLGTRRLPLGTSTRRGPRCADRLAVGGTDRPTFALIVAAGPTGAPLALRGRATTLRLSHDLQLPRTPQRAGEVHEAACRLYLAETGSDPAVLERVVAEEARPLGADAFEVGAGGRFCGYDARRGHYVLEPTGTRDRALHETLHFAAHPHDHDVLPLRLTNDAQPRQIYVLHRDRRYGRLEAGVICDAAGQALPILVQGSKNFQGENEEPFYDPGDATYAESYFPLALDPGESLALRSYHARQNWGAHPLKQVSSLQAWMPYYQMSVGVTETTCYVPFRFGGPGGIWIADLRGISGQAWTSEPQYDNVGGHRFFHYRHDGHERDPRYLRSDFRLTGPNMCWWGMDHVTEGGEARVRLEVFEMPQTDETRDFATLRVDFDQALHIADGARDLQLVSIDTTTQSLRYAAIGYSGHGGTLREASLQPEATLPQGVILDDPHPWVALYRCRPDSGQAGNNAIVVRHWMAQASGLPLPHLAVWAEWLTGGNLRLAVTLPPGPVTFAPGDFIELALLILPYGGRGSGPETPLREQVRYGSAAPSATARAGQVLAHFPTRVRVDDAQHADITVCGGYGVIPLLFEGFTRHAPPTVECSEDGTRWRPLVMTAGGPEGHHCFRTTDDRFGFVFLLPTDGSPLRVRVRP